mgnify:CR=1 FL=1
MSTNIQTVQEMYAAFSRGDLASILSHLTEDISWEAEGPARLSFAGVRSGIAGATEFFNGLAAEHSDPKLAMTEFFEKPDAVAAFGRCQVIVNATGKTVDTPVAHYFGFRDGKVCRYINLANTGAFLEALES